MNSLLRKTVSFKVAYTIVLTLNTAVILFHLLVLLQILPDDVVWAGRLKSEEEVYVFELISIAINVLLIVMVLLKMNGIRQGRNQRVVNIILWVFVIVFVLNTIGNLTSARAIEAYVATPLTLILAVCCARLAMESPNLETGGRPSGDEA